MKSFMTGKFLLILIKSNVREATLTKIITKDDNHQDQITYFEEEKKAKTTNSIIYPEITDANVFDTIAGSISVTNITKIIVTTTKIRVA